MNVIGAINGKKNYRDSMGELPINLPLHCTGDESRLRNCPGSGVVPEHISTCQISDNAYVICQGMHVCMVTNSYDVYTCRLILCQLAAVAM